MHFTPASIAREGIGFGARAIATRGLWWDGGSFLAVSFTLDICHPVYRSDLSSARFTKYVTGAVYRSATAKNLDVSGYITGAVYRSATAKNLELTRYITGAVYHTNTAKNIELTRFVTGAVYRGATVNVAFTSPITEAVYRVRLR